MAQLFLGSTTAGKLDSRERRETKKEKKHVQPDPTPYAHLWYGILRSRYLPHHPMAYVLKCAGKKEN